MTEKPAEVSEDLVWVIGYMVWGPVTLNDKCLTGGAAPSVCIFFTVFFSTFSCNKSTIFS